MKSNVNEIFRGFFWGIGFSVALALCVSAYLISVLPKVDDVYKEVASNRTTQSLAKIANDYQVNVLDIYKTDSNLKVTVEVKNLTDEELYGKSVNVKLFSKSDRFISACNSKRGDLFIKPKGVSYHEVSCKLSPVQLQVATKAKASLNLY